MLELLKGPFSMEMLDTNKMLTVLVSLRGDMVVGATSLLLPPSIKDLVVFKTPKAYKESVCVAILDWPPSLGLVGVL